MKKILSLILAFALAFGIMSAATPVFAVPGYHTVILSGKGLAPDVALSVKDGEPIHSVDGYRQKFPDIPGYYIISWSTDDREVGEYFYEDFFWDPVYKDMTLYPIMFPTIPEAEVYIEPLKCGTVVHASTQFNGYYIYTQDVTPSARVPAGSPYKAVIDDSTHWLKPDSSDEIGYSLFGGTVKGGEVYYTQFYLQTLPAASYAETRVLATKEKLKLNGNFESAMVVEEYITMGDSMSFIRFGVKAEHDWGKWTVTKPATATADGLRTRTCAGCGKADTHVIPEGTVDTVNAAETDDGFVNVFEGATVGEITAALSGAAVLGPDGTAAANSDRLTGGMIIKKPGGEIVTTVMPGDVDMDGEISVMDAREALRAAIQLSSIDPRSEPVKYRSAKSDKTTSSITVMDARQILRAAIGLEDPRNW